MNNIENKLKELFESQFLDDVYDIRTDGLSYQVLKKFINKEGNYNDIKGEIDEIIIKISSTEIRKKLQEKLSNLDSSYQNESDYLLREYYKFGIVDGVQLKMEIRRRGDKK